MRLIREFAKLNPNMSDVERLTHLYWGLRYALASTESGAIIEVGCHEGLTSAFLAEVVNASHSAREIHLFDSFEGRSGRERFTKR